MAMSCMIKASPLLCVLSQRLFPQRNNRLRVAWKLMLESTRHHHKCTCDETHISSKKTTTTVCGALGLARCRQCGGSQCTKRPAPYVSEFAAKPTRRRHLACRRKAPDGRQPRVCAARGRLAPVYAKDNCIVAVYARRSGASHVI